MLFRLLDRALLSLEEGEEFDLNKAQKIFGYFDKSQLNKSFSAYISAEMRKKF